MVCNYIICKSSYMWNRFKPHLFLPACVIALNMSPAGSPRIYQVWSTSHEGMHSQDDYNLMRVRENSPVFPLLKLFIHLALKDSLTLPFSSAETQPQDFLLPVNTQILSKHWFGACSLAPLQYLWTLHSLPYHVIATTGRLEKMSFSA